MRVTLYLIVLAILALNFREAYAADRILVLLNSRDEMNLTARLAREGVRLAIEEAKRHPRHRELPEFTQVDFDDNVMKAAADIQAAVTKYRPIAMIGTIRSDHAIVAAEIAEKERIPLIIPLSTNPKVTAGKKYTFRTCFDDNDQAESLAAFIAKERGRQLTSRNFCYHRQC